MQPGNPRSALVLGGGGILGAAYEIGVLAVLEERYGEGSILRTFDLFLGTSAGSFVAAVISQGIPPGRLFRAYRDRDPELLLRPQDVSRVRWGRLLSGALKFLAAVAGELAGSLRRLQRPSLLDVFTRGLERLPAGFLSIDRLDAYLCALFAREGLSNHFADLSRPLLIPAVDLDAGVVHVFGRDPEHDPTICQAVTASSAVPQLFAPVLVGGRHYVDGAVGGATHLDAVLEHGPGSILFVNPVVPSCTSEPRSSQCECRLISRGGLGQVLDQTMKIQHEAAVLTSLDAARARHPDIPIVDITPVRRQMPPHSLMDYDASMNALDTGFETIARASEELLAQLDGFFGPTPAEARKPAPAERVPVEVRPDGD